MNSYPSARAIALLLSSMSVPIVIMCDMPASIARCMTADLSASKSGIVRWQWVSISISKIIDGFVKSQNIRSFVIPTKVGIQSFQCVAKPLDSRFHGNDDFLRGHQLWVWKVRLIEEEFKKRMFEQAV